jgi:hypothetical protein
MVSPGDDLMEGFHSPKVSSRSSRVRQSIDRCVSSVFDFDDLKVVDDWLSRVVLPMKNKTRVSDSY